MTDLKSIIREHVKVNPRISTPLGPLEIDLSYCREGANSLVYKTDFNGPAVIKFLTTPATEPPSGKYARFIQEFKNLLRATRTDAVVHMYYFGTTMIGKWLIPFIVMEHCPYTIREFLKENPIQYPGDLMVLLKKLLTTLEAVHNENIVHRDLKPENVFVRADGSFILGDFGIAWFDPEHYERLAKTSPAERLANFRFCAPEQLVKGASAAPTMDIYAVGQILYWSVAGDVVRGTHHKSLAEFNSEFGMIDPIIEMMIRQNPAERYQSASQAIQDLDGRIKHDRKGQRVIKCLEEFDERLSKAFPGLRGLVQIQDLKEIERLLVILGDKPSSYDLWWTTGELHLSIDHIKKDGDLWVIGGIECNVSEAWIFRRGGDWDRPYVLLKSEAMTPFGIYECSEWCEEAGLFQGRYIPRREFDDGYAWIDGQVVKLDERTELRVRYLEVQFLFIATKWNAILQMKNDPIVGGVHSMLKRDNLVAPEILEPLEWLEKNEISAMYD